jgi:hypothetical protein
MKDYLSGPAHNNNLQPIIPHMFVPPQEVCAFSAQQSFDCTTSLPGIQQQARHEFLSTIDVVGLPLGNHFPDNLSHLERVACSLDNLLLQSTGENPPHQSSCLTTCFFSPASKSTPEKAMEKTRPGIAQVMATTTNR